MDTIKYGKLPLQTCTGETYFIGDVHSEGEKLISLIDKFKHNLKPEDRVVFLGDLFDRGPTSALTVDTLVALNRQYPGQIFFVKGNHDWMLQHYLMTGSHVYMQYLGSTLSDFKTQWNLPDMLPDTIMAALIAKGFDEITSKMLPYYETEEVIATHAPLNLDCLERFGAEEYEADFTECRYEPGFVYLLDRLGDDIMWEFVNESESVPHIKKFMVCGHQPGADGYTLPRFYNNRAFIDTGCGKGNRPVTAMIWPGKICLQSEEK